MDLVCIHLDGVGLSEIGSEILVATSQRMAQSDKRKIHVTHDECMGTVTTKWEYVHLGPMSGVVFFADVATPKGSVKVQYLLPDAILELSPHETKIGHLHLKFRNKSSKKLAMPPTQKDESHKWN